MGKTLTMDTFEDRLEVQKIPYLAQVYGINLNYVFSWYLRGPYSKQVTKDGYDMEKLSNVSVPTDMENDEKVREFKRIIEPHMNDPTWLEIAASVVYLREKQYKDKLLDQIIGYLVEDMTCRYKNFDETSVRCVMEELATNGLLKQSVNI